MVKPKNNIWSYFTDDEINNKKVKCVFCSGIFYKNATRLEKHLKNCSKTPTYIKLLLKGKNQKEGDNRGDNGNNPNIYGESHQSNTDGVIDVEGK